MPLDRESFLELARSKDFRALDTPGKIARLAEADEGFAALPPERQGELVSKVERRLLERYGSAQPGIFARASSAVGSALGSARDVAAELLSGPQEPVGPFQPAPTQTPGPLIPRGISQAAAGIVGPMRGGPVPEPNLLERALAFPPVRAAADAVGRFDAWARPDEAPGMEFEPPPETPPEIRNARSQFEAGVRTGVGALDRTAANAIGLLNQGANAITGEFPESTVAAERFMRRRAAELEEGRPDPQEGFFPAVSRVAGRVPFDLAAFLAAASAGGIPGVAAYGALSTADQGPVEAIKAAGLNAAFLGVGRTLEPYSRPTRMAANAGAAYALTKAAGGSDDDANAEAAVQALMAFPGRRWSERTQARIDRAKAIGDELLEQRRQRIRRETQEKLGIPPEAADTVPPPAVAPDPVQTWVQGEKLKTEMGVTEPVAPPPQATTTEANGGAGNNPPTTIPPIPPRPPPPVRSDEARIALPGGEDLRGRYALVEGDVLLPSHDPFTFRPNDGYPEGVQERTYHDLQGKPSAEQAGVLEIADRFDPERILIPNVTATEGVPIVTEDGIVLGGNKRTMGMLRAYGGQGRTPPEVVRRAVLERAARFGLDPKQAEGMERPMIVRVLPEDAVPRDTEGLRTLGSRLNDSGTFALGRWEEATSTASRLGSRSMTAILDSIEEAGRDGTTGEVLRGNKRLAEALEADGIIRNENRARYLDRASGELTTEGVRLIEDALVARTLGKSDVLNTAPRSILQGIARATPSLIRIKEMAPEIRLPELLLKALESERVRRNTRGAPSLEDFLGQRELIDPDAAAPSQRDPLVAAVHRVFDRRLSGLAMKRLFAQLADDVAEAKSGQGTMFGEGLTPEAAVRRMGELAAKRAGDATPSDQAVLVDTRRPSGDAGGRADRARVALRAKVDYLPPGPHNLPQLDSPILPDAPIPRRLVSRSGIMFNLARALGANIVQGDMRSAHLPMGRAPRDALGFHIRPYNITKIRTWNDIQTAAHELAHYLQDSYRVRDPNSPTGHRNPFERFYDGSDPALERDMRLVSYDMANPYEGFAELVRTWMTQRDTLAQRVPRAVEQFDAAVQEMRPAHRRAMLRAQRDMHRYFGQGAVANLIEAFSTQNKDPRSTLASSGDWWRQALVDDLHGIVNAFRRTHGNDASFRNTVVEAAYLLRGASEIPEGLVKFGVPTVTNDGYTFTGKGLQEILRPVASDKNDMNRFFAYATARQARELMQQGRENLVTRNMIDAGMALENPRYRAVFDDLLDFQGRVADFGQAHGLFSQAQRDRWMRTEYAWGFFRDLGRISGSGRNGALESFNPVRRLRGSSRNLVHPLNSMIEGPSRIITAALENSVRKRIADEIGNQPGGGRFMVQLARDSQPVRVLPEQIRDSLMRELLDSGMPRDQAKAVMQQFWSWFQTNRQGVGRGAVSNEALTLWTRVKPHDDNLMTVLRNGQPEYWQLADPLLVRAIGSFRRPLPVAPWVNAARRAFQNGITSFVDFMGANAARDPVAASILTKTGNQAFTSWLSGFKSVLSQDAAYRSFLANLGGGGGLIERTPEALQRSLVRHARRHRWDPRGIMVGPRGAIDALLAFSGKLEMASRVGEFKRARRQGESASVAAHMGREVVTDWSRRGDFKNPSGRDMHIARFMLESVPFLSATIASQDRLWRATPAAGRSRSADRVRTLGLNLDERLGVAARTAAYVAIGLAAYELVRDDPEYQRLSQAEKAAYVHFPRELTGGEFFPKVPVAFEFGTLLKVAEQMTDMWRGSSDPIERSYADNLSAILSSAVFTSRLTLPVGAQQAFELLANRKGGAPIETAGMQRYPKYLRAKETTPQLARKVGELSHAANQATGFTPEISPAMFEATMRGFFNGWADLGFMLSDHLIEPGRRRARGPEETPFTRRFLTRVGTKQRTPTLYWETVKKAEQTLNEIKLLEEREQYDQADALYDTPDAIVAPDVAGSSRVVQDMQDEIEEVLRDDRLSPDERAKQVLELTKERNAYMEEILLETQEDRRAEGAAR